MIENNYIYLFLGGILEMNKILNFELTIFSVIVTFLELVLTVELQHDIYLIQFLIYISVIINCIIFITELRRNEIFELLGKKDALVGRLYYSELLKSEYNIVNLIIGILTIVLLLIIFYIVTIV